MRSSRRLVSLLTFGAAIISADPARCAPTPEKETLRIVGPEVAQLNRERHDGGLPLAPGVASYGVFRASITRPDLSETKGYTYNHHPDLAAWHGRLYFGWNSGERDEDTWPARELFSTSENGRDWSAPTELFPQGISTPLRLYFFHAPNGHMLAFAGLRLSHDKTDEAKKGPLVVREIRGDHTLGPVFTLRPPGKEPRAGDPAAFTTASDAEFVVACRALLANHVALETQDYGLLLADADQIPWHDAARWPGGKLGSGFLKAPSFFRRPDGTLVGIGKNGWTLTSPDGGATWTQPTVPSTLVTNNAKVWGQRTSDGRYALVYNPQPRPRFPLALVTSDDGVTFRDMRSVQPDFPAQRYPGLNKNIGLQYVRGIAEWASDGSWPDDAMWIAYSANKEDLWVSRVPLAKSATASPTWNIYQPKWAHVAPTADGSEIQIENREPCDAASASRGFVPTARIVATLELTPRQLGTGNLEIELTGTPRGARPIHLRIGDDDASSRAALAAGRSLHLKVTVDCAARKISFELDGRVQSTVSDLSDIPTSLDRFTVRLNAREQIPITTPLQAELDQPTKPSAWTVRVGTLSSL